MMGTIAKEDQQRAEEFDRVHREAARIPKGGRNHPGAKELASGYTTGYFDAIWFLQRIFMAFFH